MADKLFHVSLLTDEDNPRDIADLRLPAVPRVGERVYLDLDRLYLVKHVVCAIPQPDQVLQDGLHDVVVQLYCVRQFDPSRG